MDLENSTLISKSNISESSWCEKPTNKMNILYTIFLTTVMVLTIFGNIMVIVAVGLFPRLRRMTNYFIVSLAVSDLLYAIMSLPLRLDQTVHNFNWCLGLAACTYWIAIDAVFSSASICNLAAVSIDRFIAITKPLDYPRIMTKKTVLSLIGFVWFYACLWGLLSLFNWDDPGVQHITVLQECQNSNTIYYTSAAALSFLLPLLIVLFAYSWLLKIAFEQTKAIARKQLQHKKKTRILFRELKAAKTLGIVVGVFVVSWLPFFIILLLAFWCPSCLDPMRENKRLGLSLKIIFIYVLPQLNSCMNPVIYTVFNKEFRKAFRDMLTSYCSMSFKPDTLASSTKKFSLSFLTNAVNSDSISDSSS